MEGLGEKFQKARALRNLTLEEAARMTKIRPSKLAEIEAEDFSQFPSLAYAKGFVMIYGKFLEVDVTPYLEAFETSEHMTVDGYSYLQDNPVPAPRRSEVVPKRASAAGNKSSLLPLVIGIVVLIVGFSLLKFIMDLRRLKPVTPQQRDAQALAQATPAAAHPLPAHGTPAPTAPMIAAATPPVLSTPVAASRPTASAIAEATPPTEEEPEIRRAEPVHAADLAQAKATPTPSSSATPAPVAKTFDIRPLRRTFLHVTVDTEKGRSSFERWVDASAPIQVRGRRIAVKALDPSDVEVRKNGKLTRGDADVRVE
ncbi:MAG: helix-turn-helix domain-containing protein [Chthoniobacterales bacterium]